LAARWCAWRPPMGTAIMLMGMVRRQAAVARAWRGVALRDMAEGLARPSEGMVAGGGEADG